MQMTRASGEKRKDFIFIYCALELINYDIISTNGDALGDDYDIAIVDKQTYRLVLLLAINNLNER